MSTLSGKPTISVIEWASRLGWGILRSLLKCRLSHLHTSAALRVGERRLTGGLIVVRLWCCSPTFCRAAVRQLPQRITWKISPTEDHSHNQITPPIIGRLSNPAWQIVLGVRQQ